MTDQSVIQAVGIGPIVDAITNSAMQALAGELRRQGRGGLGDSRELRAAVREVVRRGLHSVVDIPDQKVTAAVAELVPPADETPNVRELPASAPMAVPPREACRMLSVGLTRLYELLHEGQLESFRYGRSRRISTASIRAYIDRHVEASPTTWGPPP